MKLAPPWRQPTVELVHLLICQLSSTSVPWDHITYTDATTYILVNYYVTDDVYLLALLFGVVVDNVVAVIGAVVALENVTINICFVYDLCLLRCLVVSNL